MDGTSGRGQPTQTGSQTDTVTDVTPAAAFGEMPGVVPAVQQNSGVLQVPSHRPPSHRGRRLLLILGVAILAAGGVFFLLNATQRREPDLAELDASQRYGAQAGQLNVLGTQLKSSSKAADILTINGQLKVTNQLTLQPSTVPQNPVSGQFYYDSATNQPLFYNGSQFVPLAGSGSTNIITNAGDTITNITNISGGGGAAVLLQSQTPGTAQIGNSNITGTAIAGQVSTAAIISPSSALTIQGAGLTVKDITGGHANVTLGDNGATLFQNRVDTTAAFQVQNASGNSLLTVDTASGSVAVSSSGSGNVSITTAGTAGVSGGVTIKTGDSSTTASGDITIDTGAGVVDGEVIADKTFETGLDGMGPWFGSTVAQSTAQAHTGTHSLAMTATGAFWGVIENFPGSAVVPGHQYSFSVWARAATTPRTLNIKANWVGTGGSTLQLSNVIDGSSGWIESTAIGTAPAGATNVFITMQSTGTAGEVHYFDDITVTDLSAATAASSINIGKLNAKIITIGNASQIGATSIFGGSGINLNAGAGNLTLNGGVISVNGSAASSIATTAGALTLTSAAAATWSISPASTGDGGDLTIRAGNAAASGNTNGGNLVLQAGTSNGTGTGGGVIVRPQTNSTLAFQIQNSASTPLFTADSSNMKVTVLGATSTFASLTLTNTHFNSTQTTAPTIGVPANCGTSPSATVTAGSTDTAGSFTITTGTGGTSSTCDTIFTFNKAYGAAPKSIMVVGKGDAASAARQVYVSASSPTTYTASFGASAAGANSTPYQFNYWVVE